jgi:aspartate-semialdehyde dehydrogenase
MLKIGFIGWRGMVGSVLMERMVAEKDFKGYEPLFFTTSNVGGKGPDIGMDYPPLKDAFDLTLLSAWTSWSHARAATTRTRVYPRTPQQRLERLLDRLRFHASDGKGRHDRAGPREQKRDRFLPQIRNEDLCGRELYREPYADGRLGTLAAGHVEWISSMTYQAASGAGANHMRELIAQMSILGIAAKDLLSNPGRHGA